MIQRQKIFIILGSIYDYMPVGANYLAQGLFEEGHQVIFCEQPSFLFLFQHPKYILRIIKNNFIINLRGNKLNVISLVSKSLPISHKERFIKRGLQFLYNIQDKALNYQINKFIKAIQAIFGGKEIYVIFNDPFSYRVAEKLQPWFIIFRVCDIYEKYPDWIGKEQIVKDSLKQAINGSNMVVATSKQIYKNLSCCFDKTIEMLPNGYQPLTITTLTIPKDLKSLSKPIIGFTGALNSWINYELIKEAALARPNYSFVLIGPILTQKVKILNNVKNIHLLGYKQRQLLGNYYCHFDVAIAPFIINELSKGIDPIKFYEYLAFGLPLITTPIAESKKFQGLIYIANDFPEFISLIDKALKENNLEIKRKRKEFADNNTWRIRAQELNKILDEYIK